MIDLNLKNNSKEDRAKILVDVLDQVFSASMEETWTVKNIRYNARTAQVQADVNTESIKILQSDIRGLKTEKFTERLDHNSESIALNATNLGRLCVRLKDVETIACGLQGVVLSGFWGRLKWLLFGA